MIITVSIRNYEDVRELCSAKLARRLANKNSYSVYWAEFTQQMWFTKHDGFIVNIDFFISHITLIKLSIFKVNAAQGRDKRTFVFLFCKAPVLLLILSAWLWLNMFQYLTIRQTSSSCLWADVVYEALPNWLSFIDNKGKLSNCSNI